MLVDTMFANIDTNHFIIGTFEIIDFESYMQNDTILL